MSVNLCFFIFERKMLNVKFYSFFHKKIVAKMAKFRLKADDDYTEKEVNTELITGSKFNIPL